MLNPVPRVYLFSGGTWTEPEAESTEQDEALEKPEEVETDKEIKAEEEESSALQEEADKKRLASDGLPSAKKRRSGD